MTFQDDYFSKEHHYSLGNVIETKVPYLSIPVTIGVVDYEEYYALSKSEYERFMADQSEALMFAERCRKRLEDDRLIQKPGWNRGIPH